MEGNGQDNNTGMAIENHASSKPANPTSPVSSASPTTNNMTLATSNTTNLEGINNPTPPRRPSYEDDDSDPARPRKRPATLATVELLSAECMSTNSAARSDVSMMTIADELQSPRTNVSSEGTLTSDPRELNMSDPIGTSSIAASDHPETDGAAASRSDDTHSLQDSDGSSQNLGDSEDVDEESYRNNNYVVSNQESLAVSDLDDAPSEPEPVVRPVLLSTFEPHTANDFAGRQFWTPVSRALWNDIPSTILALKELQLCIEYLANAESMEEFKIRHVQGNSAWIMLPSTMVTIFKKSSTYGLLFASRTLPSQDLAATIQLLRTFRAFFTLALRMVQCELERMVASGTNPYRPICISYMSAASEICRAQIVQFPQLHTEESEEAAWEYFKDITDIVFDRSFGITTMRAFLDRVLERLPQHPDLIDCAKCFYKLPSSLLKIATDATNLSSISHQDEIARTKVNLSHCTYDLSLLSRNRLNGYINDTFLDSKEDFNLLVDAAAHLLNESVVVNPQLVEENAMEFQAVTEFSRYPSELHSVIADACMRMTIYDCALRKCKKLEVRLHALTTICNELLEVWKKRNMRKEDPLLQCIAQFIKGSQLVEYILGPHSHFQLIQKAGNVVGFLIVMGEFDQHFVEIVWQPILVVKDQREVHATIALLMELCHNMTPLNHYDSCSALCKAPPNAWDDVLIGYLERVFIELKQVCAHGALGPIGMPPYNLLIKLIAFSFENVSMSPTAAAGAFLTSKFDYLYRQLGELLMYGPSLHDKKNLINKCVSAMENGKSYQATDLYILNAVLESLPTINTQRSDLNITISQEIVDADLISILVQQTALCIESLSVFDRINQDLQPVFRLFRAMMAHRPDLIQDEHSGHLWAHLCGETSRDPQVRNCSFNFFAEFLGSLSGGEEGQPIYDFQVKLFKYFSELRPEYLVPSCLEYCKSAIIYFNQYLEGIDDIPLFAIDGVEQVWRIVINVPQDGIANEAINYLVHFFDESDSSNDRNLVSRVNSELAERAIQELVEAAKFLAPEQSLNVPEFGSAPPSLIFRRSLAVLQELLAIPLPTATVIQKAESFRYPGLDEAEISETILMIPFQSYAPKYSAERCNVSVLASTIAKDFYSYLGSVTGLQNFRTLAAGRELFMSESDQSLAELGFQNGTFMILQSRITPVNRVENKASDAVRSVILKNFTEISGLLTLPEEFSHKIWQLVRRFNPQPEAYEEVKEGLFDHDDSNNYHPFKLLYALWVVMVALSNANTQSLIPASDILKLTAWTSDTLISFEPTQLRGLGSRTEVVNSLISCLLSLMNRSKSIPTSDLVYDSRSLIPYLLSLLGEFEGSAGQEEGNLCIQAFKVILAVCDQTNDGLEILETDGRFLFCLRSYLLQDYREHVRKGVKAAIVTACRDAYQKEQPQSSLVNDEHQNRNRMASYIWKGLYDLIPYTSQYTHQSITAFEATHDMFALIQEQAPSELQPSQYFSDWWNLLIRHQCQESINDLRQDHVINGLVTLLIICSRTGNGYDSTWTTTSQPALQLQERFLFPPRSGEATLEDPEAMETGDPKPPIVITSSTRRQLNSLSLSMIGDTTDLESVVDQATAALAEAKPGLPVSWIVDRTRWLRSEAGHVGLKNLSNTCYLNSLLTQLFMNLPFRDFIMRLSNATETQTPLTTLQEVFANLQDSWQKAFEPKDLVATIRDYEGELIDPGIQMDVEEFYNLLCDRIETQINTPESKKEFRDLFGGSFVQQIKSMECEHVSEREEPFSAIQCDIKGKKSLQESLKAYVEGETLNGDNKYSCTNCNRHVDAIKRTCLKQIPDQVIFHLKRFEFDMRTMNRSKINDVFEFPTRIDLHPYTIEAINGSSNLPKADDFELVGVLVHSGTAETGHYYSYIKERALNDIEEPSWFEFNDSEVSFFDPSTIPSSCFGGLDSLPGKDGLAGMPFMKPYSAYMLFYERVSAKTKQPAGPFTFDQDLQRAIFIENEQFLRRYCLFDPSHLDFITRLAQQQEDLNSGICSEQHQLENKTLRLLIDTFELVASRIKECDQTPIFLNALERSIKKCHRCCEALLEWLNERSDVLRNLLLRCWSPKVRQEFGRILVLALKNLDADANSMSSELSGPHAAIQWIAKECNELFDVLALNLRSWDEYFGFLYQVAELSDDIACHFINTGFLRRCLDIMLIEYLPRGIKMQYGGLARLADKGRKIHLAGLLDFVATLLESIDLSADPVEEDEEEERLVIGDHLLPLSRREYDMIRFSLKKNGLFMVYKPLDINANLDATKRILKHIVISEPEPIILTELSKALHATAAVDPAHLAEPSLHAILVFFEYVKSATDVRQLMRKIALEVKTIGSHGGIEHLEFFKMAFEIQNLHFNSSFVANQVIETAHIWAPPLLTYHDDVVRLATEQFLVDNLVGDIPNQSQRVRDNQPQLLKELATQSVLWVDGKFVRSRSTLRDESRLSSILRILDMCCCAVEDDNEEDQDLKLKVDNIRDSVDRLVIVEEDEPSDLANSDTASFTQDIDLLDNDYSSN